MKLVSQMTVVENPRPREAVAYTSDHGYASESEFLFEVARWIVEQGGTVSLVAVDPEAVGFKIGEVPFELHVVDVEAQDSEVFEPMDVLVHFGHGTFAVLDAEYFAESFTVQRIPASSPSSPWIVQRPAMITDPPTDAPNDVWKRLAENARLFANDVAGRVAADLAEAAAVDNSEQETDPIAELVRAIGHTVDYVGTETLKPIPGWSWFDALSKYAPDIAAGYQQAEADEPASAPYITKDWPGLKDGARVGVEIDGEVFIGIAQNTPDGLVVKGIPVPAEPADTGHDHSWTDQQVADLAYGRVVDDISAATETGTGDA